MKKLLGLLCCCYMATVGYAQCDNEYRHSVGVVYLAEPEYSKLGVEGGYSAGELPLSLHAGVTVDLQQRKDTTKLGQRYPRGGQIYTAIGYRFIRVDYRFSLSIRLLAGLDYNKGAFSATSLQVLLPFNRIAFSIEPQYNFNGTIGMRTGLYCLL